jgi:hypothetical protein
LAREQNPSTQDLTLPTVIVGLFLGLHVLIAFRHPASAWGLDMLAYLPASVHGVLVLLSILLLLPSARQRLIHALSRWPGVIHPWGSPRSSVLLTALLLAVALVAFVLFRSATHLLGDGYLYLRELGRSVWQSAPRTGRVPLSFWVVNTLHESGGRFWHSADLTYRITSYVSGALYLLLSIQAARILGRDHLQRAVVFAFLLTPGYLQLFFGYVENYPFLFPATLLYVLACAQAWKPDTVNERLLLSFAALPVLFTLVANPEIGAFRGGIRPSHSPLLEGRRIGAGGCICLRQHGAVLQ